MINAQKQRLYEIIRDTIEKNEAAKGLAALDKRELAENLVDEVINKHNYWIFLEDKK